MTKIKKEIKKFLELIANKITKYLNLQETMKVIHSSKCLYIKKLERLHTI